MLRGLKIETPSKDSSSCSRELVDAVTELQCRWQWLDLVEREYGYIIGIAQGIAEQRAEDRAAEKEAKESEQ